MDDLTPKIIVENLDFFYDGKQALYQINIDIYPKQVTALIGPSGCGKSTFLRCLNRMNDTIPNTRLTGNVLLDGENIYSDSIDLAYLRQKVGMVFQKPNPFPKSVYDNVAYGPRRLGLTKTQKELNDLVEHCLNQVGLWDEVKDHLKESAFNLSLEQQQRLCISRVVAVKPEVILMDEPTSALDPISTMTLEELVSELKESYTIVIVTHNMEQAARVSEVTGLFWLGELIEFSQTERLFTLPAHELTEGYITGRMG
ncbi:MAG: phosphate ABC transporter ATP-binding protein PstB [Anaerolineales bacterium]|jgi:phosphate transport system ATP-binding protein